MIRWISLFSLLLFSFQAGANQCGSICEISKLSIEEAKQPPCHQAQKEDVSQKNTFFDEESRYSSSKSHCSGACFDDLAFSSGKQEFEHDKKDTSKKVSFILNVQFHRDYLSLLSKRMGFIPIWKDPPLANLPLYLRIQRLLN